MVLLSQLLGRIVSERKKLSKAILLLLNEQFKTALVVFVIGLVSLGTVMPDYVFNSPSRHSLVDSFFLAAGMICEAIAGYYFGLAWKEKKKDKSKTHDRTMPSPDSTTS